MSPKNKHLLFSLLFILHIPVWSQASLCQKYIDQAQELMNPNSPERDYPQALKLLRYAEAECPERTQRIKDLISLAFERVIGERDTAIFQRNRADSTLRVVRRQNEATRIHNIVLSKSVTPSQSLRFLETGMRLTPDNTSIQTTYLEQLNENRGFELDADFGRKRHLAGISHVCYSPDGKHICTSDVEGNVKLWNISGEELWSIKAHKKGLTPIAFSPDGQFILSGGQDSELILWDRNGKKVKRLEPFMFMINVSGVTAVDYSPSGKQVVVSYGNGNGYFLDLATNKSESFHTGENIIWDVVFSPDEKNILVGGQNGLSLRKITEDGKLETIWEIRGEELLEDEFGNLSESFDNILSLDFSPHGQSILVGRSNGRLSLLEASGEIIWEKDVHEEAIMSVCFSPDGQSVLTGSSDRTAKLWDIQGNLMVNFRGHGEGIMDARISPDGQSVVTGSSDRTAKIWQLDGREQRSFHGHGGIIVSTAFSSNGKYVVTGGFDRTIRLWTWEGQEIWSQQVAETPLKSVDFFPNGQRILSCGFGGDIKIWDLTGNNVMALRDTNSPITSAHISPNGYLILTGHENGESKIWEWEGDHVRTLEGHQSFITSVNFSPDGKNILTSSADGLTLLRDVYGAEKSRFLLNKGTFSITFSPNSHYILTADSTANLWDLKGNKLMTLDGHEEGVFSVAFSPSGKQILTGGRGGVAKIWDLEGNELNVYEGHLSAVVSAAFSPDEKYILTGSADGTAKLWDISYEEAKEYHGDEEIISTFAFSSNGKAYITGNSKGEVIFRNTKSNEELSRFKAHESEIISTEISPNGKFFVTSGGMAEVRLWDIETGNYKNLFLPPLEAAFVDISLDGKVILLGGKHRYASNPALFDASGKQIKSVGFVPGLTAMALSTNGKFALTGQNEIVKLWDLSKGKEYEDPFSESSEAKYPIREYEGHQSKVTALCFSPTCSDTTNCPEGSAKYIATGSIDGIFKLWDMSGQELWSKPSHAGPVLSATFSPDGKYILTGSEEGSARLWDLYGNLIYQYKSKYPCRKVQFSLDGKYLILGFCHERMPFPRIVPFPKIPYVRLMVSEKDKYNIKSR